VGGHPHQDSQGNGFRKDAISQVGREGSLGHDIHRLVDEILQILLESHEVQERAAFFKRHEQIEVTVAVVFTPGQGAEDAFRKVSKSIRATGVRLPGSATLYS
jgi:hypothetical protein